MAFPKRFSSLDARRSCDLETCLSIALYYVYDYFVCVCVCVYLTTMLSELNSDLLSSDVLRFAFA